MKGKKILLTAGAITLATAGTLCIAFNTRSAKAKRFLKQISKTLFTVGSVMQTVSGVRQSKRCA